MVGPTQSKISRIGTTGISGKLIDVDTLAAATQYTYHIDIRGFNQILAYIYHKQPASVGTCAFIELTPLFHFYADDTWDNQGWTVYPEAQPFENALTEWDDTTGIHEVQSGPILLPLTVSNNAINKIRIPIPSQGDNYVQFTYRGLSAGGLPVAGGDFALDVFGALIK